MVKDWASADNQICPKTWNNRMNIERVENTPNVSYCAFSGCTQWILHCLLFSFFKCNKYMHNRLLLLSILYPCSLQPAYNSQKIGLSGWRPLKYAEVVRSNCSAETASVAEKKKTKKKRIVWKGPNGGVGVSRISDGCRKFLFCLCWRGMAQWSSYQLHTLMDVSWSLAPSPSLLL